MGIYQRSVGRASSFRGGSRWLSLGAVLWSMFVTVAASAQVVPFVPTPLDVVERMLSMGKVGAGDYLIDLGSGDGRVVREAARRLGTRGMGVELDPELVARSNDLARRDGLGDKASFVRQDLFETDLSPATVVTMYLLPAVNLKLRPRLLSVLKPGTRIVSHDFDMGDWAPDATTELYSDQKFGAGGVSQVFLWIVPADVAGRWQWRMQVAGRSYEYELRAVQRYQKVDALVRIDGEVRKVEAVRLNGDVLTFNVVTDIKGSPVRQSFEGRVAGESMTGSVSISGARMHGAAEFSAERSERGPRADRQTRAIDSAAYAAAGER